jgi:hypothetical protein
MKIHIVHSNPIAFTKVKEALEGCNAIHYPEETTLEMPAFELQEKRQVFTDFDLICLFNDYDLHVLIPRDYKKLRVLYVDTYFSLK